MLSVFAVLIYINIQKVVTWPKAQRFIGQAIVLFEAMPVRSPWTWLTNDFWTVALCLCHKAEKGFENSIFEILVTTTFWIFMHIKTVLISNAETSCMATSYQRSELTEAFFYFDWKSYSRCFCLPYTYFFPWSFPNYSITKSLAKLFVQML